MEDSEKRKKRQQDREIQRRETMTSLESTVKSLISDYCRRVQSDKRLSSGRRLYRHRSTHNPSPGGVQYGKRRTGG